MKNKLEKSNHIITVDVKAMAQNDNRKIYPYLSGTSDGKYVVQYYKKELLDNYDKCVIFKFPYGVLGINGIFLQGFFDEYEKFADLEYDKLEKYLRFEENDKFYELFIEKLKYVD